MSVLPAYAGETYRGAMTATLTYQDIVELAGERSEASVSIILRTTPFAAERERLELEYKDALREADHQLEAAGVDVRQRRAVRAALDSVTSEEFWLNLSESMVLFANPDGAREFRVKNHLTNRTSVGDRFDVGPLLRSIAFSHAAYVVAVSEGGAQLAELSPDEGVHEVPLTLPDDIHTVLEYTSSDGQRDRGRALGSTGEKIELRKYCRIVQDAVIAAMAEHTEPLILAASSELQPAYREANTYENLLPEAIEENPAALSLADLETKARAVLDEHYAAILTSWRERFGTKANHGRASADLATVARAATDGAVEELLFDIDDTQEGTIDDTGALALAKEPSGRTNGIVDEIALRVLRSGGKVWAVRRADLPGESSVAAVMRYPLDEQAPPA
ncbi:hypothetical protein [Homoserinimonas hongtaonis]|uniref:Uncharacterized protein n=1 Tax=Homoserinimonas hongtaonis TaxID=2079791 RepID=A0A2U1SXD4_9MICO|nr:hypothetical protein [Salinibacterium hongtaonis]PWB96290.1 hypothetical protein DF220_13140 [Salinibacterium hongtaonis]